MNKLAQILLIVVSISSILSWAVVAYLWSDQQRLVATYAQLQLVDDQVSQNQVDELTDQTQTSLSALDKRVTQLELATMSATAQPTTKMSHDQPINQAQEYFIPMGAGSTTNTDWVDLTGTAVSISSDNYRHANHAVFEAGLSIVGGEVSARIKNNTTGAVIDISQITNNTQQPATIVSQPFQLHPGDNEYIVQLRSSSSERAWIEGARIRIVIE